ncbi:MAG TPA: GMC family oxidoreductase [Solirubrobacterales bacterium]|nr:GMC family oxidoreductase [Solirubrobacterales bacterium]
MAPGIDGLPAAERDIDVSGPVAGFLAGLSPRLLLRMRLGLRAFEWLPFPWRYSRLDPEAAQDFLRKLDSSRLSLHHDLLLMAKIFSTLGYAVAPEVEARVGVEASCALADGTLPEPAGSLGDTEPRGEGEECDVAIVGSGAGGAVAAATLAEAGLDVLVLEAGDHFDRDSYPADRLEAIRTLYREAGLTIADGRPPIPVPVAKMVGGTTVINSGTCFRAPDSVLEEWRTEHGLAWAHDLDADFAEAEDFLRVTQLDPDRMGRNGQLAMEGAAALGLSGGPIHRNAGNCVQCSSCPYGCAIDAKRGMHVSYLPRAVAAGARLRTGVEARRVLVEDGRAVGVACSARDANGRARAYTVRARRAVVAAGGSFGTPELLLRSGLGGSQVGRNLRIHPACWVGARYEEEVRGWDGVMQSYYVDQWEEARGVLLEATFTPLAFGGAWLVGTGPEHQRAMLEFGRIGSIGVQIRDTSVGRVGLANDGAFRASYRLADEDARKVIFGIARAAEVHFAAGATEVYPNIPRAGVLRPGDVPAFEAARFKPSELRLEAFHPMATARISADPRRGVCDVDGSVYGTAGLYVADASLFPTAVGVNPMMTIVALAKQVSRGIATAAADRPGRSSAAVAEAVA